jgi:ribonuclease.
LKAIKAGAATIDGENGVDWYLKTYGELPDNYIDKETAEKYGWNFRKGNLPDVAPGKIIGGDIFYNDRGKLPQAPTRIWYEADLNYDGGFKSSGRILYSNDGVVFISFDHYNSFYEIVWGL